MRVAWLTDIHVNFLRPGDLPRFIARINAERPEAVVLTGDISEAPHLVGDLREMAARLACPLYFVLGNHDYYFGSIRRVREEIADLCEDLPELVYLTQQGVVRLTDRVGLIGHDGWADARLGNYERSMVLMNDYLLIAELKSFDKRDRWPVLKQLGDEAAASVEEKLAAACQDFEQIVLATHVPPFLESCWHEGRLSDDEWLPHFTCHALGEAILRQMRTRLDRQLTVLCGHTHGRGESQILPNVRVLTGGAEYGFPEIQRVFEWS